jgi:FtsH-binding integral membrane protein
MRLLFRFLRSLSTEAREPRAREAVGYLHGALAIATATALALMTPASAGVAVASGAMLFGVLRLLLCHPRSAMVAAALGSAFAGLMGAALGYVIVRALSDSAPMAALGSACAALGAGIPASSAYARLIRRHSDGEPDSLIPSRY